VDEGRLPAEEEFTKTSPAKEPAMPLSFLPALLSTCLMGMTGVCPPAAPFMKADLRAGGDVGEGGLIVREQGQVGPLSQVGRGGVAAR
jgi:hypothetical protein